MFRSFCTLRFSTRNRAIISFMKKSGIWWNCGDAGASFSHLLPPQGPLHLASITGKMFPIFLLLGSSSSLKRLPDFFRSASCMSRGTLKETLFSSSSSSSSLSAAPVTVVYGTGEAPEMYSNLCIDCLTVEIKTFNHLCFSWNGNSIWNASGSRPQSALHERLTPERATKRQQWPPSPGRA